MPGIGFGLGTWLTQGLSQAARASSAYAQTVIDFESQTPGVVATLPSWITFTRSSDQFAVQSSSTTVASGLTGANKPYIGNRGGALGAAWGTGLSFEEARTSLTTSTHAVSVLSGSSGSSYSGSKVGPDGVADCETVTTNSLGYSSSATPSGTGGGYFTSSYWVKSDATQSLVPQCSGTTYMGASDGVGANTWSRVDVISYVTAGRAYFITYVDGRDWTANGGRAAGARTATIDFMQIEAAPYATDPTVSGARTAPSMSTSDRSQILRPDGRLISVLDVTLSGAPSQYSAPIQVSPYFSARDAGASISNTTGKLSVTIGGSTWTPNVDLNLYLWAGSRVRIAISAGGGSLTTKAKLQFENGWVLDLGESSSPQSAIPLSGACYLLDNNGSNIPTGLVHSLKYKVEPSWFTSGTTAWIPSALTPSLWLRGGLGMTLGTVGCSTWSDQSTNARNVTQATGSKQPLVRFQDKPMNARTSMVFTSSSSRLLTGTMTGLNATEAYSIYGVFKRNVAANTNNPVFSLAENPYSNDAKAILSFHAGNSDAFMYGHAAGVYTSLGAIPAVETCSLVGGKLNPGVVGGLVWRYGSATVAVDAPTHVTGDVLLQIGGEVHGGGGTFSDASTAEIILVNRVITATEEANLIAYLNWGYRQSWTI